MRKNKVIVVVAVLLMAILMSSCQNSEVVNTEVYDQTGGTSNEEVEVKELTAEEKEALEKKRIEEELEKRRLIEEERKVEAGEFYVPLVSIGEEKERERVEAKGLYVTGNIAAYPVNKEDVDLYVEYINALKKKDVKNVNLLKNKLGSVNKFERIVATAVATEINSFVIDVKDDDGIMTYKSNVEIVEKTQNGRTIRIKDVEGLLNLLEEYEIYPIARIVTFKDRIFSRYSPEHSIQLKTGGVWKDRSGVSWINPFDEYVWNYNIAIAKEAALLGFKEIQFDYVRFPANARSYNKITEFPHRNDRDKDEAIEGFLERAKNELEPYNVNTSADVFGVATKSWDDKPEDIGQTWRKISRNVDHMSPMIYPSHYGKGWYGFDVPDAHPYGVLSGALKESIERNASIENQSTIRPWIQGFTASWVKGNIKYGVKEIRDQIIAGKELGVNEYLVWSASNNYNPLAFIPGAEEMNIVKSDSVEEGKDVLSKTPSVIMNEYLKAEKRNIYSKLYLLTPIEHRDNSYEVFKQELKESNMKLTGYKVISHNIVDGNNAEVKLTYKYVVKRDDEEIQIEKEDKWKIIKENGIWKVIKPEIKIPDKKEIEDIENSIDIAE